MNRTESDRSHWGRYWASGPLTSLPQDFRRNYDGEIADFWSSVFERLPETCRVLDVCTGNGAVAVLAAERLQRASVVAIDAAPIDPALVWRAQACPESVLERVRFIGESRVEDIPAEMGPFDLVTSQYGLEYTSWVESARALGGLLRPGALLALVVHAPESAMAKRMQNESREYSVLDRSKFCAALSQFGSGAIGPAELRSQLSDVCRFLHGHPDTQGSQLLLTIIQSCQALLSMPDVQLQSQASQMRAYAQELEAGHQRLRDMLAVNEALEKNPEWYKAFEAEGFTCLQNTALRYGNAHDCGTGLLFEWQPN